MQPKKTNKKGLRQTLSVLSEAYLHAVQYVQYVTETGTDVIEVVTHQLY